MSDSYAPLTAEQALALRLVRSQAIPHEFWLWSNGNLKTSWDRVTPWVNAEVTHLIKQIIDPNWHEADPWERQQSHGAETWISAIFGFVATRGRDLQLSLQHRLLAASILPLYRSLGTGKLHEALDQTRLRLAEALAVIGMAQELESDFVEMLEACGDKPAAPHLVLQSSLNIDLKTIAHWCRHATRHFDVLTGVFSEELFPQNVGSLAIQSSRHDFPWSDPSQLWQIAGELQTLRADFILPRQWADTPLPWRKINDHWGELLAAAANFDCPAVATQQHLGCAASSAAINNAPDAKHSGKPLTSIIGYEEDDEVVSKIVDDLVSMQTDFADVTGQEYVDDTAESVELNGYAHVARPAGAPSPKIESALTVFDADESATTSQTKIVLAEISSNADPLFVSVVSRHVSTARSEARTACLVALKIASEDRREPAHLTTSLECGLTLWQQKLVNWLANQPDLHETQAFVSVAGELILCTLDVERSMATKLFRDGLESFLTNKRTEVEPQSGLTRVSTPTRYYAGIGSVSSPNVGFAAEQLIAATWRCLSAAQSQGKSAIKSIEVF